MRIWLQKDTDLYFSWYLAIERCHLFSPAILCLVSSALKSSYTSENEAAKNSKNYFNSAILNKSFEKVLKSSKEDNMKHLPSMHWDNSPGEHLLPCLWPGPLSSRTASNVKRRKNFSYKILFAAQFGKKNISEISGPPPCNEVST